MRVNLRLTRLASTFVIGAEMVASFISWVESVSEIGYGAKKASFSDAGISTP